MNTNITDNRTRIRELCGLAGSQQLAAQLIEKHTKRPCSIDTIKSWTCDRASLRARNPQQWAIDALEKELKKLKKLP